MASRTWVAILLSAVACSDGGFFSPGWRSELARAEAQWKARPFADYQYEILQSCFCPSELNRWTRVTVQGERVVAAEPVEPDAALPPATLAYRWPIDSLFGRLRRAADDPSTREIYRDIVVKYDAALGYPTRAEWVSKPNIADAGVTILLKNVTPFD